MTEDQEIRDEDLAGEFHEPDSMGDDQEIDEEEAAPPPLGYAPYDPLLVKPTIYDPLDEEGNALSPRLVDAEGNALPEFDRRYQDDFHGLAYLGALSKTFEWMGHKFVIRTLTVDEALQVSVLVKQYADTIGQALAYRTAVAALAVQRVDNQDLPVPIGADADDFAYAVQRFNYAKARWFQFTIEAIYSEYLELEEKTRQVIDAMGKASTLVGSTPG